MLLMRRGSISFPLAFLQGLNRQLIIECEPRRTAATQWLLGGVCSQSQSGSKDRV